MQSVPITTDVVSSNLDQGMVYNIMWCLSVTWDRSMVFSGSWGYCQGAIVRGAIVLDPLQLYSGGQFYWWRKPRGPGENHRPVSSHWQTSHKHLHQFLLVVNSLKKSILFRSISVDTLFSYFRDRRGRDSMIVGFITTYAISAYHHWCCEFESRSGHGVQHYVMFVSDLRQVDGFLRINPTIILSRPRRSRKYENNVSTLMDLNRMDFLSELTTNKNWCKCCVFLIVFVYRL
jgi:hypothetical protein